MWWCVYFFSLSSLRLRVATSASWLLPFFIFMISLRLERLCFLLCAFLVTTMFRASAAAFVALSSPRQPSARQIRYVPWTTTETVSTKPRSFVIQPCWAAKQLPVRFYGSNNNDNSNWKVPDYITIPEHALEFKFVRSSGAGGQNVNKVRGLLYRSLVFYVIEKKFIAFYRIEANVKSHSIVHSCFLHYKLLRIQFIQFNSLLPIRSIPKCNCAFMSRRLIGFPRRSNNVFSSNRKVSSTRTGTFPSLRRNIGHRRPIANGLWKSCKTLSNKPGFDRKNAI